MNYIRKAVNQHLLEYLKLKEIKVKKYGKVHMLDCPFCNESESVNIIPNIMTMNCHACEHKFDLVDLVNKLENKESDESIQYLKELLNINIVTPTEEDRIEEILDFYETNNFALIPIAKGQKRPIWKDWTNKIDKNKEHWKEWVLYNKVNLSVLTGKNSNIVIIDLDILSKEEKDKVRGETCSVEEKKEILIKRQDILAKFHTKYDKILNSPLIQETVGGEHLFYKYVEEFPKTEIEIDGIHIDLETDGGQVVIEPSQIGKSKRSFKELVKIPEMSKEFKELVLSKITTLKKTSSETIQDAIESENFKINPANFMLKENNLENCCNSEFIKFGGILRKQLAIKDVEFVINAVNKHFLEKPMDYNSIRLMCRELEKYVNADESQLYPKILEYINNAEEATKRDIKEHTRETEGRVSKALAGLVKEGYIIKRGRYYKAIQQVEWKTNFGDYGQLLNYKIPYFDDYAIFRNGDSIIIGAPTGSGKTHIAMNIIKQFKDQGVVPCYIPSESGGRWSIIAQQLGLGEGDFKFPEKSKRVRPESVELKDNAVTIIDWLLPQDYSQTDKIFERFDEQLDKHGGILIVFVQLRQDGNFYAKDLLSFFSSWVCKLAYENEERTTSYFETTKIREGKNNRTYAKIPCVYDKESKLLLTVDEKESKEEEK